MHSLPFEQQLLVIIQGGACLGLCVRMWWAGLHRVYIYFFSYLIWTFLQTFWPLLVPFDSLIYRNIWLATESLDVCFYVLVILELYSVVLQDLAGMASLSRLFVQIALAVAILASLLLVAVEKNESVGLVGHLLTFERAIIFSLVLFVLLLTAFLVYYPVPLKRNVIIYSIGYAVYFLTKATAIFILNLGHYWNRELDNVRLATCLACFLFWLFALSRRGEAKRVVLVRQWNARDEDKLVAQLKAINTSLLRTARK